MKFYRIESHSSGTIGCELTKKAAYAFAEARGYTKDDIELETIECDVSAETIRRLLGQLGGFAKS